MTLAVAYHSLRKEYYHNVVSGDLLSHSLLSPADGRLMCFKVKSEMV